MSIRLYKWTLGALLLVAVLLGWHCWVLFGQVVAADFIDKECRITQESFRDFPLSTPRDPAALAHDLEFLMAYYEAHSKGLAGSHLEQIVRRDYEQALTNALAVFRSETTNDLGSDPHAWVKKYGK